MTHEKIKVDPAQLDWVKGDGLLPAIVQHARNGRVLMLGYMNRNAFEATQASGKVTFFSRSKQRLWTKGETSGNVLDLCDVHVDCDADTLLILAEPRGPACHTGAVTCFGENAAPTLTALDALIEKRHAERPESSYTSRLFDSGIRRMAQKVGEEGVEMALAGVAQDDDALLDESADLVYHLLVLLRARGLGLDDVAGRLRERRNRTA